MTDMNEITNVVPVRPLDEAAALDWLRTQPGGSTTLPAAALARRWGWNERRTRRRLDAWQKSGHVRRRGRAVMAVGGDVRPLEVTLPDVRNQDQGVDIATKRNPAIRSLAAAAGQAAQLIEFPLARYVVGPPEPATDMLDGVPEVKVPSGPPPVRFAPPPARPILRTVIFGSALALASVSGWYSITGLTSVFVGAFWPVIAMGVALEAGKLCAVAALPTLRWGPLKAALVALVAVLMGLNAIGCYGFLARAQIEHAVFADAAIESRETQVQAKLDVQAGVVADLDKRIAQIDRAVETATARGRTNSAMQLAVDQKRNRAELVRERQHQADVLADMKAEGAGLSVHRRAVATADLGPIRYLAALAGVSADETLRLFVLLVACLLDPAAVLLLLAASARK
jgi:hypothetical protein